MTKNKCFPQRSIDIKNGLKEEVIMAKNIEQLKVKFDKYTSVAQALYLGKF